MTPPQAKEISRLPLFKNHQAIGFLERTERGYQIEYLPEVYGSAITYHLKASEHVTTENGVNLPAYFANLLPEGLRLKAMVRSIKTSEDDLFSLFAASGQDCIGDLTCAHSEVSGAAPLKLNQVNFYELFDESLKHAPHESIAGVQEKISASMISFPLNLSQNKKRFLLKLNPKDKENLVENEFACMNLAKACGLITASVRKVSDRDSNLGLLVERFDRVWNEKKNDFDLLHQEDGCQFLNLYPSQKYLVSINTLAKKMTELVPSPELEVLQLIKQVAFSYLIGNGDLHAKNLSLQDVPGRARALSPAYDLISTCIYGDEKLALKLDGFDDNLSKELLVDFCGRFDVPAKASTQMLEKLTQKFEKLCPVLFSEIKLSAKERARLERVLKKRILDLG